MTGFLSVKNFAEFQHYKDRAPPWIKLYNNLLDNYEFAQIPDESRAHLIGIWLLASRYDNRIPNDAEWIGQRISATTPVDLDILVVYGFLMDAVDEEEKPKWASRYINKDVRSELLRMSEHKCSTCADTTNLEIDHVVPISKGGTSDVGNLQVLCRSCNRKKRVRSNSLHRSEHMRSLEREGETETEGETDLATLPRKVSNLW
jgi:hypothetical protein